MIGRTGRRVPGSPHPAADGGRSRRRDLSRIREVRRQRDPYAGGRQWRRRRRHPSLPRLRRPRVLRGARAPRPPRSPSSLTLWRIAAIAVAVLAIAAILLVVVGGEEGGSEDAGRPAEAVLGSGDEVIATEYRRRRAYHSPQKPGYTAWVGAWIGPQETLNTAFVQATGPVPSPPDRDWAKLDMVAIILSSADGGESWETVREDPFDGPPYAYTGQATLGLDDGTIIRRVNGEDLAGFAEAPGTAFLERLEPGSRSWSGQQILLDPERFTYNVSRIQELSDGRLITSGGYWEVPAGQRDVSRPVTDYDPGWLLMTSDDEGRSWQQALTVPEGNAPLPNEWDLAELPNGDLLAVMRTAPDPVTREQSRSQAILRREGDGWVMEPSEPAPFPHSGHPELLATREGPVLHIATTGIHYTLDAGRSWRPLPFAGGAEYRSGYYPSAVQSGDGTIYVLSHAGADDPYGARDQSIIVDAFRLASGSEGG